MPKKLLGLQQLVAQAHNVLQAYRGEHFVMARDALQRISRATVDERLMYLRAWAKGLDLPSAFEIVPLAEQTCNVSEGCETYALHSEPAPQCRLYISPTEGYALPLGGAGYTRFYALVGRETVRYFRIVDVPHQHSTVRELSVQEMPAPVLSAWLLRTLLMS